MTRGVQSGVINSKLYLAQLVAESVKGPEELLKSVFSDAMQQLEVVANISFESPMKEKVWSAVSNDKLKILNDTFIHEFCNKILKCFSDQEASIMLEERKKTGLIRTEAYLDQMGVVFDLNIELIHNAITEKANSIKDAWMLEIVEAVKKEGIALPESKQILSLFQKVLR